jgi:MFS family permease
VGRLLVGLGCGFSFVGVMKLATQWFPPRRFALVSGLTMMLGMIGGVGGQAPVAALVALWGWRGTMMAAAVGALVLAAAIWLIVRNHPEAAESVPAATPAHESPLGGFGQSLRIRETWLLSVCGLAMGTPLLAFASLWAVPYLMAAYGLSRPAAAAMSSLVIVGWGAGAPVLGWLSDRLGRRKIPILAAVAIELIAFVTLVYVPGIPFVLVQGLMFVLGLAIGAMPILYALSREHSPLAATGATLALVNMAVIGAGAIFQPVVGWLLDLHWDGRLEAGVRLYSVEAFQAAFLVIVASLGIGLLAGLAARET